MVKMVRIVRMVWRIRVITMVRIVKTVKIVSSKILTYIFKGHVGSSDRVHLSEVPSIIIIIMIIYI